MRSTVSLVKTGFLFFCFGLFLSACLDVKELEFIPFQADFEIPDLVRINDTFQIRASETVAGAQTFRWEFGLDSIASDQRNPSISYDSIGFYPIKLYIEKPNGLNDSIVKVINVLPMVESENTNTFIRQFSIGLDLSDEIGSDLVPLPTDAGFLVLGKRNINGLFIQKLSPTLDSLETIEINDLSNNQVLAQSILPTPDGGLAISGNIEFFTRERDGFLLKLDSLGNREWLQTIRSSLDEAFNRVLIDDFGNFVVAATVSTSGRPAIILLRYNQEGELLNEINIESCRSCRVSEMKKTDDGGFVLAGERLGNPLVLKLNPNLELEGFATLNQLIGSALNVSQLRDGKFVISGYVGNSIQDSTQAFLAKFDAIDAGESWLNVINIYQDAFYDVKEDINGDLVVLGTNRNPLSQSDVSIAKFDSENGELLDMRFVGTSLANSGIRLLNLSNQNLLFVGTTKEENTGSNRENIFLVEIQPGFFEE